MNHGQEQFLVIRSDSYLMTRQKSELVFAVKDVSRPLLIIITYRAKLLNPDWLRQRAFFLNHEGTFGNQEGMIT